MSPIVVAALVQVAVLVGLVWPWSGDSDPTVTTVDWGFVVLILATPTVLAGSFLVRQACPATHGSSAVPGGSGVRVDGSDGNTDHLGAGSLAGSATHHDLNLHRAHGLKSATHRFCSLKRTNLPRSARSRAR